MDIETGLSSDSRSERAEEEGQNLHPVGRVSEGYPRLPSYVTPEWQQFPVIETGAQLRELGAVLETCKVLSIDTETYGHGAEPLNTHLSLIQVGIPPYSQRGEDLSTSFWQRGATLLIDVRALIDEVELAALRQSDERERRGGGFVQRPENPLEPLRAVLENPEILKVGQNLAFEREQFSHFGIALAGGSDTMTRGRELFPELPSHSLQALAYAFLHCQISKDEQTSDWGRRPLLDTQVRYASLDPEITYLVWKAQEDIYERSRSDRRSGIERLLTTSTQSFAFQQRAARGFSREKAVSMHAMRALRAVGEEQLQKLYVRECERYCGAVIDDLVEHAGVVLLPEQVLEFAVFLEEVTQDLETAVFKIGERGGVEPFDSSLLQFLKESLPAFASGGGTRGLYHSLEQRIDQLQHAAEIQRAGNHEATRRVCREAKIRDELLLTLPVLETPFGTARVMQSARHACNGSLLTTLLPDVASCILEERVTQSALQAVLREFYPGADDRTKLLQAVKKMSGRKEKFLYQPSVELAYQSVLTELPYRPWTRSATPVLDEAEGYDFEAALHSAQRLTLRLREDSRGEQLLEVGVVPSADTAPRDQLRQVFLIPLAGELPESVRLNALGVLSQTIGNSSVEVMVEHLKRDKKALEGLGLSLSGARDLFALVRAVRPDMPATSVPVCAVEFLASRLREQDSIGWHETMDAAVHSLDAVLEEASHRAELLLEGKKEPHDRILAALSGILSLEEDLLTMEAARRDELAILRRAQMEQLDRLEALLRESDATQISSRWGSVEQVSREVSFIDVASLRELAPEVVAELEARAPSGSLGYFTRKDLERALRDMMDPPLSSELRAAMVDQFFPVVGYQAPRGQLYPRSGKLFEF